MRVYDAWQGFCGRACVKVLVDMLWLVVLVCLSWLLPECMSYCLQLFPLLSFILCDFFSVWVFAGKGVVFFP